MSLIQKILSVSCRSAAQTCKLPLARLISYGYTGHKKARHFITKSGSPLQKLMTCPQPLIDYGISIATGRAPITIPEDQRCKLTEIWSCLSSTAWSPESATLAIGALGLDPKSVAKIFRIISVPHTPPEQAPMADMAKPDAKPGPSSQHRHRSAPWTTEEDERLLAGIYQYGLSDWLRVSEFVGSGRSRAQCGQRWLRCLDPNMRKDKWSPEEDQLLLRQVEAFGEHSWAKIAKELGYRTDVQCRYRYTHHLRNAQQVKPMPTQIPMMPTPPAGLPGVWANQVLSAPVVVPEQDHVHVPEQVPEPDQEPIN